MKSFARLAVMLALAASASAQTCPKVSYTANTSATLKSLIAAVNCLSAAENEAVAPAHEAASAKGAKGGVQVDTFKIVGPQHSRAYGQVVLAVLTVPTGGSTKTAVVTPDSHEASVTAEAGGPCSVTINSDKTVDSRCYLAGGTVYIVYR